MRDPSRPSGDGQGDLITSLPSSSCRIIYLRKFSTESDARSTRLVLDLPYVHDHVRQSLYSPDVEASGALESALYEVQSVRRSGVLDWAFTVRRESDGRSSLSLHWCNALGGLAGAWLGRVVLVEDDVSPLLLPSSAPAPLVELVSLWTPYDGGAAVVVGVSPPSHTDNGAS